MLVATAAAVTPPLLNRPGLVRILSIAALCLLVALGFLLAWVFGLLSARIASRARDESLILDADDLRRLREQAQVRRTAGSAEGTPGEGGDAGRVG